MIIGLTGCSGTGKSTACDYFKKKGYFIIDADKVAREVCSKGEMCLEEIADAFGSSILDSDGNLIRHALGDIVFNDKDKLALLNSITHRYIVARTRELMEQNKDRNIVLDAPLLFEAGMDGMCDVKVCVLSEKENRIERITLRDGISREQALARIASQPEDGFYISACDVVLCNNGNLDSLIHQLEKEFGNGK